MTGSSTRSGVLPREKGSGLVGFGDRSGAAAIRFLSEASALGGGFSAGVSIRGAMKTNRVGSSWARASAASLASSDAGLVAITISATTATISRKKATRTATMRWSKLSSRSTSRLIAR